MKGKIGRKEDVSLNYGQYSMWSVDNNIGVGMCTDNHMCSFDASVWSCKMLLVCNSSLTIETG